jgi:hypothetical protein
MFGEQFETLLPARDRDLPKLAGPKKRPFFENPGGGHPFPARRKRQAKVIH